MDTIAIVPRPFHPHVPIHFLPIGFDAKPARPKGQVDPNLIAGLRVGHLPTARTHYNEIMAAYRFIIAVRKEIWKSVIAMKHDSLVGCCHWSLEVRNEGCPMYVLEGTIGKSSERRKSFPNYV